MKSQKLQAQALIDKIRKWQIRTFYVIKQNNKQNLKRQDCWFCEIFWQNITASMETFTEK